MNKFRKGLLGTILGAGLLATAFAALQPWNYSKQELISNSVLYTVGGVTGGAKVMYINSGTKNISYGSLVDGGLNPYLTGAALNNYVSLANSGTYFNAHSGTYYTNNPLGYITGIALSGYQTGTELWIYSGSLLTTVMNPLSVAIGTNATATAGGGNISVGMNSNAKGGNSMAIGLASVASGYESQSYGYSNTAIGQRSIALGIGNSASAYASMSYGLGTTTNAGNTYSPTAIGKYNIGLTNTIFEIGNGTGLSARSNIVTILSGGNIGINTTTPTEILTVSGNINVTNGYNVYDGGGFPYITGGALAGYATGTNYWYKVSNTFYPTASGTVKEFTVGQGNPSFRGVGESPFYADTTASIDELNAYNYRGVSTSKLGYFLTSYASGRNTFAISRVGDMLSNTNSAIYFSSGDTAMVANTGSFKIGFITGALNLSYYNNGVYTSYFNILTNGFVNIGNYVGGNYTQFSTGGFEWFYGSGMARDDIQNLQTFPSLVTAQNPTQIAMNATLTQTRCFTGLTQMQEIFGSVELPHDMYNGTGAIIGPHVHWMGNTTETTTTGTRTFERGFMKVGSVYPIAGSTGTYTFITKGITGFLSRIDEIGPDLSVTGYNIGDTLSFRLSRTPTGTDTYTGSMCLIQMGFHYQRDTNGSRQEFTK